MNEAAITHHHPIVVVAGGTGGHVFPAQALAESLRARGHTIALFTDSRGAAWTQDVDTVATHAIRAGRITGMALAGRLRGLADLALGAIHSRRLLRELRPSMVVGFGGYATVPSMMAATHLGLPTVIHEQNALLGRANRLLAPRVSAIATSFPRTERLREADATKVVFTGNPVREPVRRLREMHYRAPDRGGAVHLLVTGGSQGARVFARVVPKAIARLDEGLRARIRLTQQCRAEDLARVAAAYDGIGFAADLAPFFSDLPERLGRAHLVICRSGASTVAELTTAGRPAILVPYPSAADDHQNVNARAVAEGGGAEVLSEGDFSPEVLAARLKLLFGQPGQLASMAAAARRAGHRDAAGNLAILVAGLAPVGAGFDSGRVAA